MSQKTVWDARLGMLMACGSPGSALAYHSSLATFEPTMVHRGMAPCGSLDPTAQAPFSGAVTSGEPETDTTGMRSLTDWITSAWRRLENWSWERQQRAQEAYLARAKDLADLEARMRDIDGNGFLGRARALR